MPDTDRSDRPRVNEADLLEEARKRFQLCQAAHDENRSRYKNAISFVAGDQWDARLRRWRESQMRPCLTFDRLTTHINQVVNDGRQNKPAIKTHPVDDGGDVKTAEVFNGVIRHIERISDAPTAYETANFTQVAGNVGYWRILTEYVDDTAFDQEIVMKRVIDPLSIWIDPEAKEQDASDMRFAFVESAMPREDFQREYPNADEQNWPNVTDPLGWWSKDNVRLVEYFRIVPKKVKLLLLASGRVMTEQEYMQAGMPEQVAAQRDGTQREVQWFKLGGYSIIDSRIVPSRWIGIIRVVGNETVIDGKIIYTGMTDRMMDAQRAYNYQASTVVELLAMQKSAPYIGAKGQFKGRELQWKQANVTMPAYLEYEPVEVNGQFMPPPQRQAPPQIPTGNVQAMQSAAEDMRWISGQHAASFGAQSNEQSGRAIMARQREGDTATYHYLDNLSRSIRHTGRVLIDMIPRVYDTPRVLRIIGEDESDDYVRIDPNLPAAKAQVQTDDGVETIYNLGVGRYDVAVTVGPSYGTKRMEATDALMQLSQGNPKLFDVAGDVIVRNQDWPGSQEIADRLAKTIPPEIRGDNEKDTPERRVAEMQQQLQMAGQQMEQLAAALEDAMSQAEKAKVEQAKLDIEREKVGVSAFEAETNRMKVVAPAMLPEQVQALVVSTLQQLATVPDISPGDEGLPPVDPSMLEMPEQPSMAMEVSEQPMGESPEALQ